MLKFFFDEVGIVDVDAVADAADGFRRRRIDRIAAIGPLAEHIVDVAGVALVEGDAAERDASLIGRLIMPSRLPPQPPCATLLISPSIRPLVTPSSGLLVMMRIVPAWLDAPYSVPCGPARLSIRAMS